MKPKNRIWEPARTEWYLVDGQTTYYDGHGYPTKAQAKARAAEFAPRKLTVACRTIPAGWAYTGSLEFSRLA